MSGKKTVWLDVPSKGHIFCAVGYGVIAFWSLPFVLLLLMQGSFGNDTARAGVEIAYHVINFMAAAFIFSHYLRDSFINVEIDIKGYLKTVFEGALLTIATASILYGVSTFFLGEYASIGAFGALPLMEMDLFTISGWLVGRQPILGTICTVLLGPLTASCLFYAAVFIPIAEDRPVLAYFAMAAYLAIPRLCNGLTYWPFGEEAILYVVQLPIHLIACRSYQKANTIWAPIGVLTVSNAVSAGVLLVLNALAHIG